MVRALYVALLMCAACRGPASAPTPSMSEGPAVVPVPSVPSRPAIHKKPSVEVDQSLDEIEAALRRLDEGLSRAR